MTADAVSTGDAQSRQTLRLMLVAPYPGWNSLERYMSRIAAGLPARGFEISFACRRGGETEKRMSQTGARCLPIGPRNAVDLLSSIRMAKVLKQGRYDFIHAHYRRDYGPTILASKLSGVPALLTCHSIAEPSARRARSMKKAALVIAVSDAVKEMLISRAGISPDLVTTVRPGISLDSFFPRQGARVILPTMGVAPEATVFGMVARIDSLKGCDTLLTAAHLVRSSNPNARVLIVGDGPYRTKYQALAISKGVEDQVLFTGYVEDAAAVLREFDVFVSASVREAFAAAILEAMACGLPVIASDQGGNPEAVLDGETGILFPVGDAAALAEAMKQLIHSPARVLEMGKKGRERVESNFTVELELEELERVYRAVHRRST